MTLEKMHIRRHLVPKAVGMPGHEVFYTQYKFKVACYNQQCTHLTIIILNSQSKIRIKKLFLMYHYRPIFL